MVIYFGMKSITSNEHLSKVCRILQYKGHIKTQLKQNPLIKDFETDTANQIKSKHRQKVITGVLALGPQTQWTEYFIWRDRINQSKALWGA